MLLTVMARATWRLSLACLSLAVIGVASATPHLLHHPDGLPVAGSAAAGMALISSLGNLGAAVSPSVTGLISARTGNPLDSMFLVIAVYALVACDRLAGGAAPGCCARPRSKETQPWTT